VLTPLSILMQMLVLVCVCALLIAGASARNDNGNFLDDKWLTGRWDKFRDVSAALLPNSSSFAKSSDLST